MTTRRSPPGSGGVTPVILGVLSLGPRSGYEIKATVDRSTRFFWAASYGQIYPELSRLEREGLVESEDASNGARRRRVYLAVLRAIDARPGDDPPFVDLVLRWGIVFNEWGAQWCSEQLDRLSTTAPATT